MITRNICNVDAATLCEESFISPGQQMVSRTVGNDQDFEQGKRRCTQPLETKNRQRFRRFKSIAEKVSNLLSDRSVLTLRSSLKFPVERVGKVFDVQNCHGITP